MFEEHRGEARAVMLDAELTRAKFRIAELGRENEMLQRIAHNADEAGRGLREEVAASKERIQQLYASHERKDKENERLFEANKKLVSRIIEAERVIGELREKHDDY
jgi:predicted RNase H-like nuclease (RuvC/YqgF family)